MDSDINGPSPQTSSQTYAVFDALAVILLSLATVGSAWCSYQAMVWSGLSSKSAAQSISVGNEAMALRIKANQSFLLDVFLLSQHMEALNASNVRVAKLYSDRFGPELKHAYEAWMQTRPLENPEAPSSPFVTNFYNPPMLVEADGLRLASKELWDKANRTEQWARRYTLITVMLAAALFLGGAAPRMRTPRGRRATLVFGLVVLVVAAIMLAFMPVDTAKF